ncbi:hypothetical protein, partial [Mycobacterium sp. E2733]|uniref:hypothetical protein n=1 Tax=Mycobacterium sp. E2733 TaxID=1834138 RepID=UPI001E3D767B
MRRAVGRLPGRRRHTSVAPAGRGVARARGAGAVAATPSWAGGPTVRAATANRVDGHSGRRSPGRDGVVRRT